MDQHPKNRRVDWTGRPKGQLDPWPGDIRRTTNWCGDYTYHEVFEACGWSCVPTWVLKDIEVGNKT